MGRKESDILRFGTACSLESGKGVYTILEALKLTKELIGEFKFYIAGTGPTRDTFEQLAYNYGLGNNVRFYGFVDDMPGFYRDLDVYVSGPRAPRVWDRHWSRAGACGAVLVSGNLRRNRRCH